MHESKAELLESELRRAGSVHWRTKRELVLETRVSEVAFFFDGADRLTRVETPQDAEDHPEEATKRVCKHIGKAKRWIISKEIARHGGVWSVTTWSIENEVGTNNREQSHDPNWRWAVLGPMLALPIPEHGL